MSRALPPLKGHLRKKVQPRPKTPPLPDNPYKRFFTENRSFEELAAILSKVQLNEKMGVCLDTCHIFDGGYDIVSDLDGVLAQFDKIIGLERLKAVHLNDSLNICGSHKDRHACIGAGNIGLEALTAVINHPALRALPFYLETPNELPGYAAEIKLLRERFAE